ncbi:Holliday junction resolvase [Thermococcus argininiproducens]|uniref:Holliday junction resolvase n=1 Tax=Thermococcus argininiproducens TaxID=2866384 RepID=A0A9E7M9A2_9EURY|nr:Holliday junction resolvase-like protein [Thermococcus argininiproducens]USG99388.1 Holliday junction resolvase [Thermococcus argininiproducens]
MPEIMWIIIGILMVLVFILWYKYSELKGQIESRARELFEYWKSKELETQKQVLEDGIRKKYEAELQRWKQEEEKRIREDAIKKSKAVIMGQVTEHLIPYFPDFKYNPKDARFIGTPVDFVVFDGLSDGEMKRIVFVEVKTGKSGSLTSREKQVREVVEKREVYWEKIHYKPNTIEINNDMNGRE